MEIRKNNLNGSEREVSGSEERLEGFAAAEMADRGPKDILQTSSKRNTDTDAAGLRPVGNPGDEEGDEDYDDEDDDTDAVIGDDIDDNDIDDVELDEDDLDDDIILDDEDEEDEDEL